MHTGHLFYPQCHRSRFLVRAPGSLKIQCELWPPQTSRWLWRGRSESRCWWFPLWGGVCTHVNILLAHRAQSKRGEAEANLGRRWELLSWWAPPSFVWWRFSSQGLEVKRATIIRNDSLQLLTQKNRDPLTQSRPLSSSSCESRSCNSYNRGQRWEVRFSLGCAREKILFEWIDGFRSDTLQNVVVVSGL